MQHDKQTQLKTIKRLLDRDGKVTRNQSIRLYIYRLSAIIYDLRNEHGYQIEGYWKVNKKTGARDYVYQKI